jgi:two-component system, OmpR family, sensor histidine kinase KdpD
MADIRDRGDARGKLKIFLGYAAGVGKTYQMLAEAQELKRQGHDVVIGYFEPHGRKDTIAQTEGLETVPRRKVDYRGTIFEEMDTDAILRRNPEICVVDEFPHTNVPGSERLKRWQDVQFLLDAGIDVFTTMNIQHLESLNDQIWQITGIRVRETIPDWVMQQADQVVMVDLTPRALLNRLARGVVYSQEKAQKALENFFQESTLVVLREMALRQTAHEVEIRQVDYDAPGFQPQPGYHDEGEQSPEHSDRILILVTPEPSSAMLIRRGKRVADYLQADCFAVAVSRESDLHDLSARDREAVERHLNFARNLHIETRVLQGPDVAKTLVEFAHLNGVTHLFLARPRPSQWPALSGRSLVQQVVHSARDMQVTIVADRGNRQQLQTA